MKAGMSKRTINAAVLMAALALALLPLGAMAQTIYQRVPFASTPNPVGSGGRAVAWGGAFIAVADDATAASWNPGGLVQLVTPETSVVLSYHDRMEDIDFGGLSTDTQSESNSALNLNYLSIVYPFHIKSVNMVASLNYQRLYEFDRDLDYTANGVVAGATTFTERHKLQQHGALTTLTPAFAVQVTPRWSLGVAVNIWGLDDGGDGWEQQWQYTRSNVNPNYAGYVLKESWSETTETYELSGINYVIGTHYKWRNLTLGAVYKTSWDADVDFDGSYTTASWDYLNPAAGSRLAADQDDDQTLTWPASYGFGLAYRYSDQLSFAFDAYTTQWSEYNLEKDGKDLNLLAGDDSSADIENTWQFRGGLEYLIVQPKYVLAVRGGGFYDPEPLAEEVNEFYGLSFGTGLTYRDMVVDAAVQYRWAEGVKGERVENVDSESDVQELFAIVSLIYHF